MRDLEPSMGSEDFSFMLQRSPARTRGSGRAAPKAAASCTTARYDFNDEVIPLGAGYLAALAESGAA